MTEPVKLAPLQRPYSISYSPADPHKAESWLVDGMGKGFGLRAFPTEKAAVEAAEEFFGETPIARFTINLYQDRTNLNAQALDAKDDPAVLIDRAIAALNAERVDGDSRGASIMTEEGKLASCPLKDCNGLLETNDYEDRECTECGYVVDEAFDSQINDCPLCSSYSFVINQGNIVCSGCNLELTGEDEATAIILWNSLTPAERSVPQETEEAMVERVAKAIYRTEHPSSKWQDDWEAYIPQGQAACDVLVPTLRQQRDAEIAGWLRRPIEPDFSKCNYSEDYAITRLGAAIGQASREAIADAIERGEVPSNV